MRKIVSFGLIILYISTIYGQDSPNSKTTLIKNTSDVSLYKKVMISQFKHFDFSPLISKNDNQILGFIGNNYQRIRVKYLSIKKDSIDSTKYIVAGKTKVKDNIRNFQGVITMFQVLYVKNESKEELVSDFIVNCDRKSAERSIKEEYILFAKYIFYEDANQRGSGIFEGTFQLNFYMQNGIIYYNDLDIEYSDKFSNNLYIGIWKSYNNGITIPCNWGEYRIPNSNDLDVGVGEFTPNEKYFKYGWQEYYNAYYSGDIEAKDKEEKHWW